MNFLHKVTWNNSLLQFASNVITIGMYLQILKKYHSLYYNTLTMGQYHLFDQLFDQHQKAVEAL